MASLSLADDMVTAMSEVKRTGVSMDDEHPMRHVIRSMKRTAEQILADAALRATDLAYQTVQLERDYEKVRADSSLNFLHWLEVYCLGATVTEQFLRDEFAKMCKASKVDIQGDTCRHCKGTGISEISDPCICHYGRGRKAGA